MKQTTRKPRHIPPVRFTLADRLLVTGQRLRADEALVATTVSLNYAAKWAQGANR